MTLEPWRGRWPNTWPQRRRDDRCAPWVCLAIMFGGGGLIWFLIALLFFAQR